MPAELVLRSNELPDAELQRLTEDLADSLRRDAAVDAEIPREAPVPGAKGEPITIGLIIMAAVKAGAIAAIFGALQAFFSARESSR
jgi:hypothetical protein